VIYERSTRNTIIRLSLVAYRKSGNLKAEGAVADIKVS